MTPYIRLLSFESLDGPTNMAADEAMLETAAERGIASLRFYTWMKPTLTLGYFQPAAVCEQHPNLSSLPWVRRSTGGAGIVHHRELTYAFALPPGIAWKSAESWICRFHRLVQGALEDVGVASRLVVCGEEQKFGEVLCFLHQTPGDLLLDGSKVAGSAQRKLRGAILQHGSLLLRRSEFAPILPGMEDLAGRDLFTPQELAEQLTERFAKNTAAAIEPGNWSAEERDRIPEIEAQKYANPEWNAKR
jgi:lipoate-protein ligase A